MAHDRIESLVDDGEAVRYAGRLRRGGVVGLTDERLVVVPDDDETPVSVPFDNVESVELEDFDWFLGVLSLVLVGFGLVSTGQHLLGGLGLAAAGVASLYLTYRKRDRALVHTHSRQKPVKLFPAESGAFYEAFGRELDAFEVDRDGAGNERR